LQIISDLLFPGKAGDIPLSTLKGIVDIQTVGFGDFAVYLFAIF